MPRTLLLVGTRKGAFLLESDGDRRDWALRGPYCEGWPVYHAVYDAGLRLDLRGGGERVARLGGLAEPRPRRDVDAFERGPLVRRRRRTQGLEGVEPRGVARRPAPRRGRGARDLREPRRRRDVVAPHDARRPAGQRGLGRPGQPAAGPSRHLGADRRPRRPGELLDDRAGDRRLRDRRRRRHVDAAQPRSPPRLAGGLGGGRLLRAPARPLAVRSAADVPAEPRRHAPLRRRRPTRGRRSPRGCRASSASRPPCIRTTATPST